jgi:hypothetical protein
VCCCGCQTRFLICSHRATQSHANGRLIAAIALLVLYPCWTVCIACCAYALCLVRYANRFIFGLVIAVLLMAGAIVGLVIASNEITKENHTTEGTLVSKDKGEAVRLRLRPCV